MLLASLAAAMACHAPVPASPKALCVAALRIMSLLATF
jgi:hypothetical protein